MIKRMGRANSKVVKNSSEEVTWNTHKFPEEISCHLRFDIIRRPRTLQFLRSFCLWCLQIYKKQCNDESTFSCPICGQVIHVPDGGLESLGCHTLVRHLLECIEKKPSAENEIATACEACEDPYSTQYCNDCEQNICDRCAASHKKFKATLSHKVVSSGERRKFLEKDNSTTVQQVSVENSVCDIEGHYKSELIEQLSGGTSTLMEEVSFNISDMKQGISCSLRLSLYMQPKTLPCFHNFCLGCLWSHLKYSDDIIKFTCPICRHEADNPDGGLENLGCHTLQKRLIECTQTESKLETEIPSSCANVKMLENIHLAVQNSKREQVPAYRNVPSELRFPAGPIHTITMKKSDEVVCLEKEMTVPSATGFQKKIKISPRKVESNNENDAIIEREQSNKMEEFVVPDDAVVKCAAMGQNAEIGQLYDERNGRFLQMSIFNSPIHDCKIESDLKRECNLNLFDPKSLQSTCRALGLCGREKNDLLLDIKKPSGHYEILFDPVDGSESTTGGLLISITIKMERLQSMKHKSACDKIAKNSDIQKATHVVIGIQRDLIVALKEKNRAGQYNSSVSQPKQSDLTGTVNSIYDHLKRNEPIPELHLLLQTGSCIVLFHYELPGYFQNLETDQESFQLLSILQNEIVSNDSVEKYEISPTTYHMVRLSYISENMHTPGYSISGESIARLEEHLSDLIIDYLTKIQNFQLEVKNFRKIDNTILDFVDDEKRTALKSMHFQIDGIEKNFKSSIGGEICKLRSNWHNSFKHSEILPNINEIIADYEKKLKAQEDTYRSYVKEIESKETFVNMLKSQQIACFGGSSTRNKIKQYIEMNKSFVFFFNMKLETFETYKDNFLQLLNETRQKAKNTNNYKEGRFKADAVKFLAVDLEVCQSVASAENIPSGNQICKYEAGKCKRTDCSEKMNRNKTLNLVRIDADHTAYDEEPMERAIVLLPCPGSLIGTCSRTSAYSRRPVHWLCMKCKKRLEYDLLRQVLYCKCGWAPLSAYNFRCESKNHKDFIKYSERRLQAELSKLQPVKKISLLVLGETGVGKSTWINSIVNYLSFETLKDATEASNIHYRIPASFTITDENFDQKRVTIGKESNEEVSSVKGQSSTQDPKAYMFQAGDVNVTLIDTPGIGDVRGIEKDEDNFDKILRFLGNLEELHGICILLKPNEARLTIVFRYCINELLTRIHRSAAGNIIFCFTNARGTFYRPGDTLVPLQELLKSVNTQGVRIELAQKTTYCLDNEAFRFLCAARAGQHFGEDEKRNFSESWNKSRSETVRLFDYIKGLQAHPLIETLSLNEARNIVFQLLKPIAEMSKKIQTSIIVLQQRQTELDKLKLDKEGKNLESQLYELKFSLIAHKLDFPSTVCTSATCTDTRPIPNSPVSHTIYKTICHAKCYLKTVTPEVISHPELRRCIAMDNDTCKVCKCPWDIHMHMITKYEMVCSKVLREDIKKQIQEGAEQIDIKNRLVRDNQNEITKLENSRNMYANITAKFGSFLKDSAICTYNDAFEKYIAFRIREEADKVSVGDNDYHLKSFEKVRDTYREQVKLFEKQLKQGTSEKISTEDIFKLRDELYAVEDQGGELKQIVNEIKDATLLMHEHQLRINSKPKIETKSFMSKAIAFFFRK